MAKTNFNLFHPYRSEAFLNMGTKGNILNFVHIFFVLSGTKKKNLRKCLQLGCSRESFETY